MYSDEVKVILEATPILAFICGCGVDNVSNALIIGGIIIIIHGDYMYFVSITQQEEKIHKLKYASSCLLSLFTESIFRMTRF